MLAVDQMNSCRCWRLLTQLTVGAVKSAGHQWREALGISGGTLSSKATSRCLPPLTIGCQLCSPASDLADLLLETQKGTLRNGDRPVIGHCEFERRLCTALYFLVVVVYWFHCWVTSAR